jgi:hypothetical protein
MMIENFHVKDIYGNMIEIVYDRKDYTKYHIIMIEDDATEWAETVLNGHDLSNIGGYINPDTFVAPEFYSDFELRVFEYMVRTNYELAWESYIDYVDFLHLLEEAQEISYDKEGIPHFN